MLREVARGGLDLGDEDEEVEHVQDDTEDEVHIDAEPPTAMNEDGHEPRYESLPLSTLLNLQKKCLQDAEDGWTALEKVSADYIDWCRRFYHTIIFQTTQESTRKTLDSIGI